MEKYFAQTPIENKNLLYIIQLQFTLHNTDTNTNMQNFPTRDTHFCISNENKIEKKKRNKLPEWINLCNLISF